MLTVNYFRFCSLALMLLLLPACFRKKVELQLPQGRSIFPNYIKQPEPVYITVKDVECDDCADSVLEVLSNIDEVDSADYCKKNNTEIANLNLETKNDYADAYVKVCLKDNTELPKSVIVDLLNKEGFRISDTDITNIVPDRETEFIA